MNLNTTSISSREHAPQAGCNIAEILPIRRKTPSNQSINQSINPQAALRYALTRSFVECVINSIWSL